MARQWNVGPRSVVGILSCRYHLLQKVGAGTFCKAPWPSSQGFQLWHESYSEHKDEGCKPKDGLPTCGQRSGMKQLRLAVSRCFFSPHVFLSKKGGKCCDSFKKYVWQMYFKISRTSSNIFREKAIYCTHAHTHTMKLVRTPDQ